MKDILKLLQNNAEWASRVEIETPGFFARLKRQQKPNYLWIGCSDSRVPANQITGLLPGEVFVHRNISNQVINTDMNLMCVLRYAVDVLRVKHIIICGHYGCGGIEAVLRNSASGILEHWLESVRILKQERRKISADELSELNVIRQVENLSHNTIVQRAWEQGRKLYIHGWIYSISDGRIKDLNITVKGARSGRQIRHNLRACKG
jgi:carbonic anhydrase